MNRTILNSAGNSSAPSFGASSLVTDANSALSSGSHVQRSASINTESYPRLPASPMSFSSNMSGSSVMDGSSIVQQGSIQDQIQTQGASTATSQPTFREPGNMLQVQKKPRLDMRQEDVLPQQVIQQLLQKQDSYQLPGQINTQLHALIHQHRLLHQRQQQQQQQQIFQSLPPMQQAHMQQQQQRRQQMLQPPHLRCPVDGGLCARRLMQYVYHQRHRPPDNNILYWRKFVSEYFAPHAKKRWCLSLYDNVGNHTLGVFPQASMDVWHCGICGSKSGKGFEASVELLPRLNKIKFDSGVIDELLFLDMPHERRLSSGILLLEYAKVTLESVYEHLRVVREGQLRIVFTPDLKILSWDFCARHHEELLPRQLVAPQVNQLLQVAQKCLGAVTESRSAGVSPQDLPTNLNMFMMAGRQLARNLELQSLNDLGFSKRYVRCLQIAEVVNCMKDLIDFCQDHNTGPIESLKNYPRYAATKLQYQKIPEAEKLVNAQTTDLNALTKIMAMHPGLSNHINNGNNQTGIQVPGNPAQGAMALNTYQSLLRQNSVNSNSSSGQPDASTFSGPNQSQSPASFHCPAPAVQGSLRNTFVNCLPANLQQPPQLAVNLLSSQQNGMRPLQGNQSLQQQHILKQLLQDMMNNNRGTSPQTLKAPAMNGNVSEDVFGGGSSSLGALQARLPKGSVGNVSFGNGTTIPHSAGVILSRNNSVKSISSSQTPISGSGLNLRPDLKGSMSLPDLVREISQEFPDNGNIEQ